MKDLTKFLMIPYKKGGRDYSGADCYGLAILACAEYGLQLPDYNDSGVIGGLHGIKSAPEIARNNGIVKINKPYEGCFVRLKNENGLENHCGVWLADDMILHSSEGIGAIIENIPKWRIIDFWGKL
jgi:cell wall-associated NlpC family hydrolase